MSCSSTTLPATENGRLEVKESGERNRKLKAKRNSKDDANAVKQKCHFLLFCCQFMLLNNGQTGFGRTLGFHSKVDTTLFIKNVIRSLFHLLWNVVIISMWIMSGNIFCELTVTLTFDQQIQISSFKLCKIHSERSGDINIHQTGCVFTVNVSFDYLILISSSSSPRRLLHKDRDSTFTRLGWTDRKHKQSDNARQMHKKKRVEEWRAGGEFTCGTSQSKIRENSCHRRGKLYTGLCAYL